MRGNISRAFGGVKGANLELLVLEQTKRLTGHALERLRLFEGISEWELMPYLDDAIMGVLFMVTCRWVRDGMVLSTETVAKLFAEYALLTRQIDMKRFPA